MRIIYTDTTGAGYTRDEVALATKMLSGLKSSPPRYDTLESMYLTPRLKTDLGEAGVRYSEHEARVKGVWWVHLHLSPQKEGALTKLESTWVRASKIAKAYTTEEIKTPGHLSGIALNPLDRVTPSAEEAFMASLRECAARSAAAIDAKKDIQARIAQAVSQGLRATPLPSHATQELRDWLRQSKYQFSPDETEIWW